MTALINKVRIYYFSGTGNTEIIVQLLEKSLIHTGVTVSLVRMEDCFDPTTEIVLDDVDAIGIAYPVHAFNAPRIVFEFVHRLMDDGQDKPVFILSTSSGPFICNDYASASLRRVLKKKSYRVINEKMFYLSANILLKFPDSLIKQLYFASIRLCDSFAVEIQQARLVPKKIKVFPTIVNYLGKYEGDYKNYAYKFLFVDHETCNGCKKCVRHCPTSNITFLDNKISFDRNCMTCLRCVYICSKRAIQPKKLKKAIIQEPYAIKRIITRITEDESIVEDFVTEKTTGYYKIYYDYIYQG